MTESDLESVRITWATIAALKGGVFGLIKECCKYRSVDKVVRRVLLLTMIYTRRRPWLFVPQFHLPDIMHEVSSAPRTTIKPWS
jgi:hypothetical protein